MTANIEADYSAPSHTDGKLLVQSRFAVRNNQRSFQFNLPSTAVLDASVGGRPFDRAEHLMVLFWPLEKMPSGEDAAAFVIEVSYLDRTTVER